jgi:hypothetical protein
MDSLDKRSKRKKKDMRFGTSNVRSMYRVGSLRAVGGEIFKYKLDLVGVHEVRRDGGCTERAGEYTCSCRKGNENHELGTGFFVHKRIISAVMSYVLCLYRGGFPHAPRPYMVYCTSPMIFK